LVAPQWSKWCNPTSMTSVGGFCWEWGRWRLYSWGGLQIRGRWLQLFIFWVFIDSGRCVSAYPERSSQQTCWAVHRVPVFSCDQLI
jgi:hypothetical protein